MTTKQSLVAKAYNKHGKLIASATNSYVKTHPLQKRFAQQVGLDMKQYLHAEIACIIASRGAIIHSLHVSRSNKAGDMRDSKPCPVCQAAIRACGIKHVYYTTNGGEIVKMEAK